MKWEISSASVVGPDHLKHGTDGNDSSTAIASPTGILVGLVADGAGSAICSSLGSQIAVSTIGGFLSRLTVLPVSTIEFEELMFETVENFIKEIRFISADSNRTLADFHTTIVGVACNEEFGFLFHVGDGAAGVICKDGTQVISPPENGEFSDTTYFITQEFWRSKLRITRFSNPKLVVLATDGASDFSFETGYRSLQLGLIEAIDKTLQQKEPSAWSIFFESILSSSKANSVNGDDKSLVWAKLVVGGNQRDDQDNTTY